MIKTKKKESFPEKVLNYFGEVAVDILDLGVKLIIDPNEVIKNYGCLFSYAPRAVYNLKKSPYFKHEDNKFYVTDKGRMRIIENILKDNKHKKLKGYWFGIIFDIPEANRRERAFLRRELNVAGCKELQKSVWVTPFDIEKELLALVNLWKKDFRGDIRFLKIVKISGEDEFRKNFKIK